MWTAIKNRIEMNSRGEIVISVTYTNGETKIEDIITTTGILNIDIQIKNKISQLNTANDYIRTANTGVFVIPPDKPLTSDEVAKQTFITNYQKLLQMNRAIAGGLIAEDDSEYVNLSQIINSTFKIEYLDII